MNEIDVHAMNVVARCSMIENPTNAAAAIASSDSKFGAADAERRHIAGLLAFVEQEAHVSQRVLAGELGVALGLVNTYIKRCVKKGLIKVQQVPSRRYAYYLTPSGFAEKSRLTAEFLSWSLSFFRQARTQYSELFLVAHQRHWKSVVLLGGSDLTEIAILCAADQGVHVAAVVDANMQKSSIFNIPVVSSLDALTARCDGAIVTAIQDSQAWYDAALSTFARANVLVPPMLSVSLDRSRS